MSLQQELDALAAKISASKKIPQQIVPQFMAGIKEQIAGGKSEMALKAGDAAPAFKLRDENRAVQSTRPKSRINQCRGRLVSLDARAVPDRP